MSAPPVVLVGDPEDREVVALQAALRHRGAETVVFDALRFPEAERLSLGERLGAIGLRDGGASRPSAVYLRSLYLSPVAFGVDVEHEMREAWRRTITVFREKAELLSSLLRRWEACGVPLYNPLSASDRVRKPYQLALLEQAGLPVPATLWTNDPVAVREFARGRRVVYKPVAGGARTRELSPDDLSDERLARLSAAPVTFQELLPGDDLRVYVIDGEPVAAYRIETEAIDFRQSETSVRSIELEPEIAEISVRAAGVLGLRFTGMDVKADQAGRPRILELNDSPMFVGFDRLAGTDVTGRLAAALAAHGAAR